MGDQDDGFLSRWSRRKALVRQGGGAPPVEPPPSAPARPAPAGPAAAQALPSAATVASGPAAAAGPAVQPPADAAPPPAAAAPAPPAPTLEEAQALTPESDFSRFVQRDVDEQVKNVAMKKLFADPHFNVMDGLDTYIDDYNTPDPLPKSILRQLVQARVLGLLDDELEAQPMPPVAGQAAEVSSEPGVERLAGSPDAGDLAQDGVLAQPVQGLGVREDAAVRVESPVEPQAPAEAATQTAERDGAPPPASA